ncbi:MAG: aldo/keto reductase [Bacteroidales bacterium]|nr:aldo/keto reductase [Bacteroidales bacterium]
MKKENISRRNFVKKIGAAAAVTSVATLSGGIISCKRNKLSDGTLAKGEIPKDKMTYRTNPKTNEKVSLLGYGCMRIPSVDNTSTRESDSPIDQEQWNRLIDYALEHGVNYIDTSPAYCKGQSETVTGIALSRHKREEFFIATKLSNFAPSTWSREESMKIYRNSFKALQVDYIDYYLLHGVGMGDDGMDTFNKRYIDNGMLDFLLKEREAGKIRNLGFSYHGDIKVFDYLLANHNKYHWDFVQIQMNYVDWKHAKEVNTRNTNAEYLYSELEKRNIPVVIMEPLLGGRLSNVPNYIAQTLKQREPEKSVASWAFRWVGSFPKILTVLSGMTYMEHLQDNLRSFCPLTPVTEDDMEFLEQTAQQMLKYPTIPCNDCKYCMPCPYGLNIPAILLHYNKCINEGNMPSSKQDPAYRKARKAFLVGYDRSVPTLRQADHCIGCNHCVPHCPQNINIPAELRKIDLYAEALRQGKEL